MKSGFVKMTNRGAAFALTVGLIACLTATTYALGSESSVKLTEAAQRAALLKSNFLRHWHRARENGSTPKVMIKLGANHIVPGRNHTGTFDLGTPLPELTAVEGVRSVSVLVLPGKGALTAVLNPSAWTYEPKPAKDNYAQGIDILTDAVYADAFTLIDLTALRPIVGSRTDEYGIDVARIVHGFDMLLVMSGSTASSELDHD